MNKVKLQQLINLIELSPPALKGDYHQASVIFEEWQCLVKKQRKVLAKKYHPDVGGSLDKMQKINDAIDYILKLKLQPPQRRHMVVFHFGGFSGSSTTSTTTTTTGFTTNFKRW